MNEHRKVGEIIPELCAALKREGDTGYIIAIRLGDVDAGPGSIAPGGTMVVTWGELHGLRNVIDKAVRKQP